MKRPNRLAILEYAKDGLQTLIGTSVPSEMDDEYLDELDDHLEWIEAEIERVKQREAVS